MKQPPQAAADAVSRLSPRNLVGKPKFRLIWSEEPKTWVVGFFRDWSPAGIILREVFERRQVNKYEFDPPCWLLEIWEPPEFWGTPAEWEAKTHQWEGGRAFAECGPYPSEGDYRFLVKFTRKDTGEPTDPTEVVIEHIFARLRVPTRADLDAERNTKQELKRKDRAQAVAEVIGDVPFAGNANSVSPKPFTQKLREDRIAKESR